MAEDLRDTRESTPSREERLGRILAEYSDRTNEGEAFDVEGAIDANPDLAEDLALALGALETVAPTGTAEQRLSHLGDYVLRRRIGRGGMGVVYEAWQRSMDRPVALKLLPPGFADERTVHRFLREARTAGRLHHPSVVSVFGMGVESDTPYYAMELVEGETLARVIKRARGGDRRELDARYCLDVAEAFAAVAEGLQHAHDCGVIHRDLKPSNLIVDRGGSPEEARPLPGAASQRALEWPGSGRLRILDFGLARLEGQETVTGTGDIVGTPQYMSPEQARGWKIPIDHRTDIYSLGATLYETLTLEPPFRGAHPQDTLSQIISRDPVVPRRRNSRVPADLETVVLKCLRKDPDDRYQSAEALAQDLRRTARGDPVEARPESTWTRLVRRARRRRGLIVSGAVLAVALVATAVFAVQARMAERARIAAEQARTAAEYDGKMLSASREIHRERLLLGTGSGDALRNFARTFIGPRDLTVLLGESYRTRLEGIVTELARLSRELPERPEAPYHEARGLLLLDRRKEAVRALKRALAREPDFAPARVLLHRLRGTEAEIPVAGSPATRLWLEADLARRQKRYGDAVRAFADLLALYDHGELVVPSAALDLHLEKGLAHLGAGELDRARIEFAGAAALPGRHIEPWLLLGKTFALHEDQHPGRAEDIFKTFYARSDDPREAAETALWVALLYLSLRDYKAARPWVELLGDTALAARLRGAAHFEMRHVSKAINAFERAIELDPGDGISRVFLGGCIYFCGEPDSGAARRPELARVLNLAKETIALGEKRSIPSWIALGRALKGATLADLGEKREAVEDARAAMDAAPPGSYAEYVVHWMAGGTLSAAGEYDAAVAAARKAATLEGETHRTSARQTLNVALARQGRLDESIAVCKNLAAEAPGFRPVYYNWGWRLLSQRRYAEAHEVWARGEHVDPGGCDLTVGRVRALLGMGRVNEALDVASEKLDAARADPRRRFYVRELLSVYGKALAQSGRTEEAVASFAQALERGPFDRWVRGELARLLHSRPQLKVTPELESLARVLEENRRSPRAGSSYQSLLALVILHVSRGTAAEALERALEIANDAVASSDRDDPEALASLAEVLFARGEPAAAIRTLEEAVRLPHATRLHVERLEAFRAETSLPLSSAPADADLELTPAGEVRKRWAALCLSDPGRPIERTIETLSSWPPDRPGTILSAVLLRHLTTLRDVGAIRIDCGGKGLRGTGGESWTEDAWYLGGHPRTRPYPIEIEETDDDPLYRRGRVFDADELRAGYQIPLPRGSYRVALHFAEVLVRGSEQRRFDVTIEGGTVAEDFEPLAHGFARALRFSFPPIQVYDGFLDVGLVFRKGDPEICGIEIVPAGE